MSTTPTSPRPSTDSYTNYTNSYSAAQQSPYHVLAQLASAISTTTSSLVQTHQEFVSQQASVYSTGVTIRSVRRDVKVGIEIDELELEGDENELGVATPVEAEIKDKTKKVSAVATGSRPNVVKKKKAGIAGGSAAGLQKPGPGKRGTENILDANKSRGVTETDPIVID